MGRITKTQLDHLDPPESGYTLHWDSLIHGFGIRVTAAGAKSFILQARIHAKQKRITLGRYGAVTVEEARRQARRLLGEIAAGHDPIAERQRTQLQGVTLGEALEAYLEARKNLKPTTVADMRRVIRVHFGDWQDKPLLSITRDRVAKRHAELGERSHAQANLAMRYLRAIFNFAMVRYLDAEGKPVLTDNPVSRLSQTRAWYRVERRRTVIKPHELKPWMDAVLALENTHARDYFVLVLLTGLRRSEAMGLRWRDVDLNHRTLTIQDPKNREPHTLPLSDYVYELLTRREAESFGDLVFDTARGPLANLRYAQQEVIERSGVPFAIHDLRRTFATVADSLDIAGYAVKALLNHRQAGDVTAGYIVTNPERLREPMQRITDYILRTGGAI